mmetsp:Transcript_14441/g.35200  ORF Transcript_14441/g.35200 Transcript_14441/m.35200 type:complete len:372 (+) Transcript_14441:100-1215(+)
MREGGSRRRHVLVNGIPLEDESREGRGSNSDSRQRFPFPRSSTSWAVGVVGLICLAGLGNTGPYLGMLRERQLPFQNAGGADTEPSSVEGPAGRLHGLQLDTKRPSLRNATETYRSTCFLNPSSKRFAKTPAHYAQHLDLGLLYHEIPKSASRSIRKALGAKIMDSKRQPWALGLFSFTCIRDPVDRFISVFNFLRHKYPKLYCATSTCTKEKSQGEAERWARRLLFEGYFEWHLWPQSLAISMPNGSPRHIDYICNVSKLQEGYNFILENSKNPNATLEATKGRNTYLQHKFKLVHRPNLSEIAVRSLCKAYYVDYCCFGIPFPDECSLMQTQYCNPGLKHSHDVSGPTHYYWQDDDLEEPTHTPQMPPW